MKKTIIALFAAALTITGCVKGDKGDTGPSGTNGTNGTNGNANVKAGFVTVNPGDWNVGTPAGFYYVDVTNSLITQDIIDNGTVSMFFEGNTGVWVAMPYTYYNTPTVSLSYGFNYSVGSTRISVQNLAGGAITFGTSIFKTVVISAQQKQSHPNTNWKDYDQVMDVVNATAPTVTQ